MRFDRCARRRVIRVRRKNVNRVVRDAHGCLLMGGTFERRISSPFARRCAGYGEGRIGLPPVEILRGHRHPLAVILENKCESEELEVTQGVNRHLEGVFVQPAASSTREHSEVELRIAHQACHGTELDHAEVDPDSKPSISSELKSPVTSSAVSSRS